MRDPDNLPEGWTKTDNNGHIHIRDENGDVRIKIDPPDWRTDYDHKHFLDADGNSLDVNGNIVKPNNPDAHIPIN